MKRSIFIWASLALFNLTSLQAIPSDSIFTSLEDKVKSSAELKPEIKTVSFIPNQALSVKLAQDQKTLVINLKSKTNEMLDWIIFEPGGEIVSRIKTDKSIDEIKLSNFVEGEYVLMIKDAEGRLLYQPFQKA